MPIDNQLYTLYTTADVFLKTPDDCDLIFRLYLDADQKLTLGAWYNKQNNFSTIEPDFMLIPFEQAGFNWQAGMFFGDQRLCNRQISKLGEELKKPGNGCVFFTPAVDVNLSKQINFEIKVGPLAGNNSISVSLGIVISNTNPSPPRSTSTIK